MQSDPALIFTDLDGTLLDHHNYRFDPALPALEAIRQRDIPLILTTSKTLAEAIELNKQLHNRQAVIVENGGAICFPLDRTYPFELTAHEHIAGHAVIRFSPPYAQIREFITRQRDAFGYRMQGFGDMSVDQVSAATGLPRSAAQLAMQRLCSEPFTWDDRATHLDVLRSEAAKAGLSITRGGRFWHLMGDTSKARAILAMRALFTGPQDEAPTVIALGDSENDIEMLQNADIAVIVRRHDGSSLECHGIRNTLRTQQQGPRGWNSAILQILAELDGTGAPPDGG